MRRLLSPTALGLALVALVLMGAMTMLGLWQLSVYDAHQHADATAALRQPPVPLEKLLGPDSAFPADGVGRPVTVSGSYLGGEQLYVRGMRGASSRYAVVTPLVTSTGSAVLVVRGSSDATGAPAPSGPVTVRGVLEPPEGRAVPLDAQRVTTSLSVAGLVSAVRPDLYSGYVLQRTSTPADSPALRPVAPPLPQPSRWSGVRNLLYACQWWVFAAFVAFMWWRITGDLTARPPEAEVSEQVSGAGSAPVSPLR